MIKLFKHIILIIAITIAFAFFLDKYYTFVFKNQPPISKLQKILQDKNEDYDVIFIGNSRIECAIDCDTFTRLTGKTCMNYGLAGSALKEQLLVLKLLQAQRRKVDRVYVQLDFPVDKNKIFPSIKAEVIPYINNPVLMDVIASDLSFAEKYIPFYKYLVNDRIVGFREVLAMSIDRRSEINLNNGWTPKDGNNLKNIKPLTSDLEIKEHPNKFLNEIEQTVSSIGNVNWIIAPYCKYRKNRSMINAFKKVFPELTSYMDIYDDTKESFYVDCGHLNREGALDFTRVVANDFLNTN